jgi:hypothetical protein
MFVLKDVGRVLLHQAGEPRPIVKDGDAAGGLLRAQHFENGGEHAFGVAADRLDLHHLAQNSVGRDAVLLRPRAVDHGSPIGTAEGGHDAACRQCPGGPLDELAQARRIGGDHSVHAQAIYPDDNEARSRPLVRCLRTTGRDATKR